MVFKQMLLYKSFLKDRSILNILLFYIIFIYKNLKSLK